MNFYLSNGYLEILGSRRDAKLKRGDSTTVSVACPSFADPKLDVAAEKSTLSGTINNHQSALIVGRQYVSHIKKFFETS